MSPERAAKLRKELSEGLYALTGIVVLCVVVAWWRTPPATVSATMPAPAVFACPDVSPDQLAQCRFVGSVRVAGARQYPPGVYNFCFTASGAIVTAIVEGSVVLLKASGAADIRYRLVPSTFYEPGGLYGGRCPANWELYSPPT